jgi:hypothetical protein
MKIHFLRFVRSDAFKVAGNFAQCLFLLSLRDLANLAKRLVRRQSNSDALLTGRFLFLTYKLAALSFRVETAQPPIRLWHSNEPAGPPKGLLIDLFMPPDRAGDALYNILGRYPYWMDKDGQAWPPQGVAYVRNSIHWGHRHILVRLVAQAVMVAAVSAVILMFRQSARNLYGRAKKKRRDVARSVFRGVLSSF